MDHKNGDKNSAVKIFAIGALISAAAGYIAGILTAPQSGKETRADIKNKATESYAAAERELKRLHTELSETIDKVNSRVKDLQGRSAKEADEALQKGRAVKQKAREVISALHDGEADDKELRRAIKDATDAIEHLRNYLKK